MGELAAWKGFVMRDLDRSAADLAVAAAERQKNAIVFVYFDGGRRNASTVHKLVGYV